MKKDDQPTSAGTGAAEDLEKASLDTVYKTLETSPQGTDLGRGEGPDREVRRNELIDKEASDLERMPIRSFWPARGPPKRVVNTPSTRR
jgi:hypothetical protein